jgi:hypothetical protein
MDKEIAALAGRASLKVVCPVCGQWLRLPENEAIEASRVPPDVLKAMASQSRLVEGPDVGSPIQAPKKPWWRFW